MKDVIKKRGITVASVMIMVLIISLIISTITISVTKTVKSSSLRAFATELSIIQEAVNTTNIFENTSQYVLSDINITVPNNEQFDGETVSSGMVLLHSLDLSKLDIEKTVYGINKTELDIYAVSFETGKVYYVAGYDDGEKIYYTLTEELQEMLSGKNNSVENYNTIVFIPNYVKLTKEAVRVRIRVPNSIDINTVNVNITDDNGNATINSLQTAYNNYTEIVVNTNNIKTNYTITLNYVINNENSTSTYKVTNYSEEPLTISYDSIQKSEDGKYVYINGIRVGNSTYEVSDLKYEVFEVEEGKVSTYFENNGIVVKGEKIKVPIKTGGITIFAKDISGNTGTLTLMQGEKAITLYDANIGGAKAGYRADKLQIGDFVDYDAGNWGQTITLSVVNPENAANVTAGAGYTGSAKPDVDFAFGGFAAGSSKNGNAVPYATNYNYVQTTDNEYITGWRVFDIDENTGVITLISAGCPEDYYHAFVPGKNYGYISEYILGGIESWKTYANGYNANYRPRDWSKDYAQGKGSVYNIENVATSAKILAGEDLTEWYTKYMAIGPYTINGGSHYLHDNNSTTNGFGAVNNTQYDNVVNNHAFYWLVSLSSSNGLYFVYPYSLCVTNSSASYANGIRPLITLDPNILLKNGGTITLKDAYTSGNTYTYNVWNITGFKE